MMRMFIGLTLFILIENARCSGISSSGVLSLYEDGEENTAFGQHCIRPYTAIHDISHKIDETPRFPTSQISVLNVSLATCSLDSFDTDFAIVNYRNDVNCTINDILLNLENNSNEDLKGLIFDYQFKLNKSQTLKENFFVTSYESNYLGQLANLTGNESTLFSLISWDDKYTNDLESFDCSFLLIYCLAISIICLVSKLTAKRRLKEWEMDANRTTVDVETHQEVDVQNKDNVFCCKIDSNHPSAFVILQVAVLILSLIIAYLFINQIVYAYIAMFFALSTISLTIFLTSSMERCGCMPSHSNINGESSDTSFTSPRQQDENVQSRPCHHHNLTRIGNLKTTALHITSFLMSLAISVLWVVNRNEDWSWVLQDTLVFFILFHLVKIFTSIPAMNKMSAIVMLLTGLFFFDIFFVFITPLFTPDGVSVMEKVALGGNSGESMPFLLKIPTLSTYAFMNDTSAKLIFDTCFPHASYSILGLGDLFFPTLLISFAHTFELIELSKERTISPNESMSSTSRFWKFNAYLFLSCLGYTVGLTLTYISLYIMETGQPALLFLVPSTILPVFCLSIHRKQFKRMWDGQFETSGRDTLSTEPLDSNSEPQNAEEFPNEERSGSVAC